MLTMPNNSDFNTQRPWARTGFDIEGWAIAAAALLFGTYLGSLWYPLFIIGLLAAVIVLAATRNVTRSTPNGEFRVLAPCDGVVSSVGPVLPPSELNLGEGERVRVRVSSSPFSPNPLFAPVTGSVTAETLVEGDPSRLFASGPELGGLEKSYLTLGEGDDAIGLQVMTAGFGLRLDVEIEIGDMLRAGRAFAKRRLGGWCDIYLPAGMEAAVWPGQTIVGAETELAALSDTWVVNSETESEAIADPEIPEDATELDLEELGEAAASDNQDKKAEEKSASELFEKLRREAQGIEGDD